MIKAIIISILFSLVFIADSHCWIINNYDVEIDVEKNGDLKITERITVDFQFESKRGIYRDIPTEFNDPAGKRHRLEITDIFVTDDKVNPYQIKLSKWGNNLRIRIGDPNRFVSGIQHYVIRYKVRYALYNLGNIDELYWNSIGTGWSVSINRGTTRVSLPFEADFLQSACYTGVYGSRGKDCKITREGNQLSFTLTRPLSPHEGMTIAVGWPSGMIAFQGNPPWWKNPWIYVGVYIPSLLGFLYLIWWNKGRDIGGRGVIQVQYEPPNNMTPIEAGTLIDERVDSRDIVAEIVDLARKGYMKIIETEEERFLFGKKRDYIFERKKDFDSELQSNYFDLKILDAIFEGSNRRKLSELKKKFYSSIPEITKAVFHTLTKKDYFTENPRSVKGKYSIIAFIIFILTILGSIFFGVSQPSPPIYLLVSGLFTSIAVLVFGQFMPRKTHRGTLMKEYLRGYEEFISRVERDVIERLFQPDKIPEVFEKTLPYAIAFGEAEKWASAFEGLFIEPPRWYEGRGSFSPSSFAYSMNTFAAEASEILSSAPRSSGSGSGGGGSSGGGGGGGGGGSW